MNDFLTDFEAKTFLQTIPHKPGVYCMLDKTSNVLYVGKARHLKKRLASYFTKARQSPKTQALVSQIANIEVTVTHTESEALILENTLIKTHKPRYNILLRDDKSYPYIYLSEPPFPRLGLYRGKNIPQPTTEKGSQRTSYFGPYPHVRAVHETLNLLQKLFPIRQCRDSFFRHRSRPCLQYQIKRCTAPCVGLIDEASYQEEVQKARLFLEGKSQTVIALLVAQMETAAQALAYEKAALFRNKIQHLQHIKAHQYVSIEGGDIDIVVAMTHGEIGCVQVLTVRGGRHVGNRAFFPKMPPLLEWSVETAEDKEKQKIDQLLTAFLPQYYLATSRDKPTEIILNHEIAELHLLTETLCQQWEHHVIIHSRVRGTRARWVEMALENARTSLAQRQPNQYQDRFAALSTILQLEIPPQRLECFDISHTFGEATVASCVVFDADGPRPSDYRRFNIENITPGDDCAAMQQALTRRYQSEKKKAKDNLKKKGKPEKSTLCQRGELKFDNQEKDSETLESTLESGEPLWPDILLIDGGIGQVKVAQTVLNKLQLAHIQIIGIAKGAERKPGLETLVLSEDDTFTLPQDSPALHLIQHIRDEAHRFAITAHRKRRAKTRRTSILEEIEGIGPKRRQRLLTHFGGLQGLSRAGVEDLIAVPGINRQLAQKIYELFQIR
jgi:excinuclease ABC subunit C